MSAERIDVLAVIEEHIRHFDARMANNRAQQLRLVHSAMSELIAADKAYDDAQFGLARARYNGAPLERWQSNLAETDTRRAAALARVQGGQSA